MKNFICLSVLLAVSFATKNFQIKNNLQETIWVGIQANAGHALLEGGGFVLNPGQQRIVVAADNWAGIFWARTGCDASSNYCDTGDCGNRLQCGGNGGTPPFSTAEITLKGLGGLDYYGISLVNGFNVVIRMGPLGSPISFGINSCIESNCLANLNMDIDLNIVCPDESKLYIGEAIREIIGCYNSPNYFKDHCPKAKSDVNDNIIFTCKSLQGYYITFG